MEKEFQNKTRKSYLVRSVNYNRQRREIDQALVWDFQSAKKSPRSLTVILTLNPFKAKGLNFTSISY